VESIVTYLKTGGVISTLLLVACSSKTQQPVASETPSGSSTSPSGQRASEKKMALVRFVQAVPSKVPMDLWFGDMKVFSSVGYKTVTPYVEIPAERDEFKLQSAGDGQSKAFAKRKEGLGSGERYTVTAEDKKTNEYILDALKDDLSKPAAGKTKVRVINASIGVGKVDIIYPDGILFGGVDQNSATSYKEISPSTGPLEIRQNDKHIDALRLPNFTLDRDKLYTLVIVGGAGQPLQIIPVTDQLAQPAGD
jgi:hypothetical protein